MPKHYDNTSRPRPRPSTGTPRSPTRKPTSPAASRHPPATRSSPASAEPSSLWTARTPQNSKPLEQLLRIEFSPRSNTEEMLFTEIVLIHWDQRRCRGIHSALLRIASEDPDARDGFQHIERRRTRRRLLRALRRPESCPPGRRPATSAVSVANSTAPSASTSSSTGPSTRPSLPSNRCPPNPNPPKIPTIRKKSNPFP